MSALRIPRLLAFRWLPTPEKQQFLSLLLLVEGEMLLGMWSANWINWLLTVAVLSFWFPLRWSWLRRLVFGYLLLFALYGLGGLVFFWLRLPFSISAMAIVITLASWQQLRLREISGGLCDKSDFVPLLSALIAAALFVPALLNYHNGWHLPIVAIGEDAISHFNVIYEIYHQQGFIYGPAGDYPISPADLRNYPQVMHLNIAAVAWAIFGFQQNVPAVMINIFSVHAVFIYALFAYLMTVAATGFIPSKLHYHLAVLPFVALVGICFTFSFLMKRCFMPQLAAMLFVVAGLILYQGVEKQKHLTKYFLPAVLLDSTIAGIWFFMCPISSALLGISIIHHRKLLGRWSWLGLLILSVLLLSAQIYYPLTGLNLNAQTVNLAGGVEEIPKWVFKSLYILAILSICGRVIAERKFARRISLVAALLAIGFSGSIYYYQLQTTGTLSYFYYKSLFSVALLLLILGAAGPVLIFERLRSFFHDRLSYLPLVVGVALILPLYTRISYNLVEMRRHWYFMRQQTYNSMLRLVEAPEIRGRKIYPYSQDMYSAYYMDRWIAILARSHERSATLSSPFNYHGRGYEDHILQQVTYGRHNGTPILFDPYNYLGRKCAYGFFRLAKKKRLQIFPGENKMDERVCRKKREKLRELRNKTHVATR